MGNEVGINLKANLDASNLQRGAEVAGDSLDGMAERIKSIQDLTGVSADKASEYFRKIGESAEDSLDAMYKIERLRTERRRNDEADRKSSGGGASGSPGDGDNRIIQFPGRGLFSASRSIQGFVNQAPHDAVGAGLSSTQGLLEGPLKAFSSLPAAAKIAVGLGAGLVGVGAIGNALSKQYEGIVPELLEATGALKAFGTSVEDQGKKYKETMNSISASAAKWNYTFDQGAATVTRIARLSGGSNFDPAMAQASAESVMRISRSLGYSTPISSLTDLAGYAGGYGKAGAEKYALWAAVNTVGSNRTDDVASAFQSIMANVLEQGADISNSQVAGTQKWLYDVYGQRAGGQGGAAAFSNLSGAVRGSTRLGSSTDILKFQAARKLAGGDDMKALMLLEKGFTPELFEEFQKQISGSSEWDKTFLTKEAFGMNLTTANQAIKNTPAGKITPAALEELAGGQNINKTPEAGIVGAQERIANELRSVGDEALNIKYAVLNGTANVVHAILHPESSEFPMTPVNSKGNKGVNRAESSGAFGSMFLAGGPIAGFGGDMLESREYIAARYGKDEKAIARGKNQLAFLTEALHNDDFMSKVSPERIKEWEKINRNEKGDWTAGELDAAFAAVAKEAMNQGFADQIIKALREVKIEIQMPGGN